MIYLSFPVPNPNSYACGLRTSWAQIVYFVYNAVHNKFPKITRYYWNGELHLQPDDVFISNVPNPRLQEHPNRTIIVDNDNFEVGKWKHGKFTKYGIDAETPYGYPYNHLLKGLHGALLKTNDVAIRKWNTDNEDVLEKKQFLLENIKNVQMSPHPIDKNYFGSFYNRDLRFAKPKMLVYHAPPLKNATQLVEMLNANFDSSLYDVVGGVQKSDNEVRGILSKYTYLAHTSYSEGFPYFANEFLCQGLPLYGHEEWWEPYGHDILKWTYDPARQEDNLRNLKVLLSDDFIEEYHDLRRNVIQSHLDRTDNNWDTFTNKLISMIQELL
jgi:hypothetical protein